MWRKQSKTGVVLRTGLAFIGSILETGVKTLDYDRRGDSGHLWCKSINVNGKLCGLGKKTVFKKQQIIFNYPSFL